MTTQEAVNRLKSELAGLYPAGEADAIIRVIFEDVLNYSPVDMVLRHDHPLPEFFDARLDEIIRRLNGHEPIQYVLGTARFHGHKLHVTRDVLIPRPETEQLVDLVVDSADGRDDLRVVDACTGSGCIAVSLARALRFARVSAFDISAPALDVAARNADALGVKVNFFRADLLAPRLPEVGEIDILVSNPPYVTQGERAAMEPQVLLFEPLDALFVPDADPMRFYRPLAEMGKRSLAPGGAVFLEINRAMGPQVKALLASCGYEDIRILRDSFGNDRFAAANQPK